MGVRGRVLVTPPMDPPDGDAIVWSVTAADRTVSGEVVIVLLLVQAERPERLYAYVTVAYYTVG